MGKKLKGKKQTKKNNKIVIDNKNQDSDIQSTDKPVTFRSLLWEPVNFFDKHRRERIYPLDILRGFALLGMIIFNVIIYMGTQEVRSNSTIIEYIYKYVFNFEMVAVFHLMLGIYLVYSQPSTKKLLLRGVQLLVLAYVLSFVRYLPIIIGVSQGYLDIDNFIFSSVSGIFLGADIFHYAGLALIIFALLRKILGSSVRPVYMLLLALAAYIFPIFVENVSSDIGFIDYLINLFWKGRNVIYPVFPWFAFSLFGAAFGCLLIRLNGFKGMGKAFTVTGIILLLSGILLVDILGEQFGIWLGAINLQILNNMRLGFDDLIRIIGVYMCWQAIFIWLYKKYPDGLIARTFSFWSNNIMTFYMWHAIVLGWIAGIYFQGFQMANSWGVVALIIIIILSSHFLTRLTNDLVKKRIRVSVQK